VPESGRAHTPPAETPLLSREESGVDTNEIEPDRQSGQPARRGRAHERLARAWRVFTLTPTPPAFAVTLVGLVVARALVDSVLFSLATLTFLPAALLALRRDVKVRQQLGAIPTPANRPLVARACVSVLAGMVGLLVIGIVASLYSGDVGAAIVLVVVGAVILSWIYALSFLKSP
jgi:hypothetical protein